MKKYFLLLILLSLTHGQDEIKGRETELQKITDEHIKKLNSQQEKKEQELMEV